MRTGDVLLQILGQNQQYFSWPDQNLKPVLSHASKRQLEENPTKLF